MLDSVESLEFHQCKLNSSDLHVVLKQFNNSLHTLILKLDYTENFQPFMEDCQTLNKLKNLKIECDWAIFKLLKNVQLTRLYCVVTFRNEEEEQMTKNQYFYKFLRSQASTLKYLALFPCDQNIYQDDLIPLILYDLPKLETFSMFMDDSFPAQSMYKDNRSIINFLFQKNFYHRRMKNHERKMIKCMKALQKIQLDCLSIDPKLIKVLKNLKDLNEIMWTYCLFEENFTLPNIIKMEFEMITDLKRLLSYLKCNPQITALKLNTCDFGNINDHIDCFQDRYLFNY